MNERLGHDMILKVVHFMSKGVDKHLEPGIAPARPGSWRRP